MDRPIRKLAAGAPSLKGAPASFLVGVAGWAIPADQAGLYPGSGSHLERYARARNAVEINSSFYRHHLPKTYARWAASVPAYFRFSVKLARIFTHDARLNAKETELRECLVAIRELGEKFGALLVQLPPSLGFDLPRAELFFGMLREHCPATVALEPRHPSWSLEEAAGLLERFQISRVIADPDPCLPGAHFPAAQRFRYFRLHGNPEIYRSRYNTPFLARLAEAMLMAGDETIWCIFDNTTFGHAHENAAELNAILDGLTGERIVS